jgi:hypothetical protein
MYIIAFDIEGSNNYIIEIASDKATELINKFDSDYDKMTSNLKI